MLDLDRTSLDSEIFLSMRRPFEQIWEEIVSEKQHSESRDLRYLGASVLWHVPTQFLHPIQYASCPLGTRPPRLQ